MKPTTIDIMESLRADGWCVVLKCLPYDKAFVIEGGRSEFDTPSEDVQIGQGKWCAEVQDMGTTGTWRHSEWAIDQDALEAMSKLFHKVCRANDERENRSGYRMLRDGESVRVDDEFWYDGSWHCAVHHSAEIVNGGLFRRKKAVAIEPTVK